ncbi:plastid-lipid associated protein PAP [Klebsormidium nitens]|uniref:Plastid-lipid associated protein PAP n=1 Tax=Klebsormidium nitens TaxID=105231 RepID=A0A1Y1HT73_KLENI|nr:plastid-lipid associated protein PAP [Klebsormidium nitens]|eukprot:GAQ81022.1 plastid-lipid associated protein PAP [Klebsormidium nitens]
MALSEAHLSCNAVPSLGLSARAPTRLQASGCLSRAPLSFASLCRPVLRKAHPNLGVRASAEGSSERAATDPSSAARLVKEDTAAALPRQLEQSVAREKELAEGGERAEPADSRGAKSGSEDQAESREESEESEGQEFGDLKVALLSRVAGLDRGIAAGQRDRQAVDSAASALESAGPGLDLPSQLDKLNGKWRLVYTSSFSSGSLGGSRPGPPFVGSNLTLGQVFQRIDVARRELDNIVDLSIKAPLPLLPPGEVTATLAHSFEVAGPSDIRITFEDTRIQPKGLQVPEFTLPSLPDFLRSGTRDARSSSFATTFVDDQVRISRGDRKELRIFVKE